MTASRESAATGIVLVHGAFRGGWAWDLVAEPLRDAGYLVSTPTLTGCEPDSPRIGTHVRLDEWVDDVVVAASAELFATDAPVVLVGHSQGGLVTTAAAARLGDRVAGVVHLDAPVPLDGQRGIDLNPPGVPAPPDGLDPATWIPARPVGPDQGFDDPALAAFVNERLVPTPLGPSLEPVSVPTPGPPVHYFFCTETPSTYPCWSTRLRLDEDGVAYSLINGQHDAPLLAPLSVVRAIRSVI
jgi:pimeloyl-ACP methyl ester carboxylesterase